MPVPVLVPVFVPVPVLVPPPVHVSVPVSVPLYVSELAPYVGPIDARHLPLIAITALKPTQNSNICHAMPPRMQLRYIDWAAMAGGVRLSRRAFKRLVCSTGTHPSAAEHAADFSLPPRDTHTHFHNATNSALRYSPQCNLVVP